MPQFDIFEFSSIFLWLLFFFVFFYVFFSSYFLPAFLKVFRIRDYALVSENADLILFHFIKYCFNSSFSLKNLFFINFNSFNFTFLVNNKN